MRDEVWYVLIRFGRLVSPQLLIKIWKGESCSFKWDKRWWDPGPFVLKSEATLHSIIISTHHQIVIDQIVGLGLPRGESLPWLTICCLVHFHWTKHWHGLAFTKSIVYLIRWWYCSYDVQLRVELEIVLMNIALQRWLNSWCWVIDSPWRCKGFILLSVWNDIWMIHREYTIEIKSTNNKNEILTLDWMGLF